VLLDAAGFQEVGLQGSGVRVQGTSLIGWTRQKGRCTRELRRRWSLWQECTTCRGQGALLHHMLSIGQEIAWNWSYSSH